VADVRSVLGAYRSAKSLAPAAGFEASAAGFERPLNLLGLACEARERTLFRRGQGGAMDLHVRAAGGIRPREVFVEVPVGRDDRGDAS